ALHAFARNVGTVPALASGDLVDLVEKDDAALLHALNCRARDLVHIDQLRLFFLDQVLKSVADFHLAALGALAEDVGQHIFDVDVHLLHALVGDDLERWHVALADFHLYDTLVERAFAQLLAKFFAAARAGVAVFAGQGKTGWRS